MNRLARINTIWRKELTDTLRDRRTLIAMVLVPIVLYPAMILGSLQGFEYQFGRLREEQYRVGVLSEPARAWLRHLLDTDPARQPGAASQPAEELVARAERGELGGEPPAAPPADESAEDAIRADLRQRPPDYVIEVVPSAEQLQQAILDGRLHAGVVLEVAWPTAEGEGSAPVTLLLDQTEIRSQMAAAGLEGVFARAGEDLLRRRLQRLNLAPSFVTPIELRQETVATPEKVGGSILGQIVPLILIIMTITGAIYPAIDLTAGERERGTLETLMVAPVPTVDLIAGKFVVVALVGMLSAVLNLLSIGGAVWLGGLGQLFARGGQVVIPLHTLPWVLLVLVPLAIMFSATLLAVCSFARSFKEAQNYVMPVMIAALIPAVVGVLPGVRLEGPLLVVPVTNITILTRDLFMGQFNSAALVWVTLSTLLYAVAAVAVAARLFGQEAVLFADSGSIRTVFQRRFFRPAPRPSAAQALLLLALVFSLNHFAQQALLTSPDVLGTATYWIGLAAIIVALFLLLPLGVAAYMRIRIRTAFSLHRPPAAAWLAALCLGLSTWVLAKAWLELQQRWLPLPPELGEAFERLAGTLQNVPLPVMLIVGAIIPGICEELFFRGYALSGLRSALGKTAAVLLVAAAFGIYHGTVHRLAVSAGLGLLFGLLVVQFGSIWPAALAHAMSNGLALLATRADALAPLLERAGLALAEPGPPPLPWVIGAAGLTAAGVLLCVLAPARPRGLETAGPSPHNGAAGRPQRDEASVPDH